MLNRLITFSILVFTSHLVNAQSFAAGDSLNTYFIQNLTISGLGKTFIDFNQNSINDIYFYNNIWGTHNGTVSYSEVGNADTNSNIVFAASSTMYCDSGRYSGFAPKQLGSIISDTTFSTPKSNVYSRYSNSLWLNCGFRVPNGGTKFIVFQKRTLTDTLNGWIKYQSGSYVSAAMQKPGNLTSTPSVEVEKSGFKVYPNPSNGRFTIEIPNPTQINEFIIRNINGQIINRKPINQNQLHFEITAGNGLYFLEIIKADGQHKTVKLIKY